MNQQEWIPIQKLIREASQRFETLNPLGSPLSEDEWTHADEVVNGKFRFAGNHQAKTSATLIDVGRRNIDWAGGHFTHQEWPTQMSRFFMLNPLMRAYREKPARAFAEAARGYIEDWIEQFDLEDISLKGNTCMDIGIRLGTHGRGGWTCALALFMDDPAWDEAFMARMLASMERQAQILWKRGIPSRPWGNHRVFGIDGLLHTALRLPFMADAEAMVQFCRVQLERSFRQQFLADGAHVELTLGYHQHVVDTFIYFLRLGRLFTEARLDLSVEILERSIEYGLHSLPGGINDTAAECADREYPEAWAGARSWRETLIGEKDPHWQPSPDAVFPVAGQVFARSGWAPGDDFLAFDAAPYSGSHAHLARLGLVFRSGGRLWLADPGTFDYEMSNPFSVYGRSTSAHSTLNLDGLNQGLGDAKLERSVIEDDCVFLHGVYPGGYWSGVYTWGFQDGLGQGTHGKHERMVLWIRGEYLLIFDAIMCAPGHTVENAWQMTPVDGWTHDPQTLAWRTEGETPGFHLQMVMPPATVEMTVHEGEENPHRGWFCERTAKGFSPAPQVVYRYPSDSTFYATLAMPLKDGRVPPQVRAIPAGSGRGFELRWPDGTTDLVALSASLCSPLDEDSPFETDSPLVWQRLGPDGTPGRSFMMDGTFLDFKGLPGA